MYTIAGLTAIIRIFFFGLIIVLKPFVLLLLFGNPYPLNIVINANTILSVYNKRKYISTVDFKRNKNSWNIRFNLL